MNPSFSRMRDRLHEMVQNFEKSNDTLTAAQANGVVDGFSQKQLGLLYHYYYYYYYYCY